MSNSALLQTAMQLHQQGDLVGARKHYQSLLHEDKNNFAALANLASLLAREGNNKQAQACYARALAVDDKVPSLWFNYANLLHKSEQLVEAEKAFRTALKLDATLNQAWFNLANLLRDVKQPDEAEKCYRKALDLQPDFPRAYTNLANLLRKQKRSAEAIELHQTACTLAPQNADSRLNLANALSDLKRYSEAQESLNQGLSVKPDHIGILLALGELQTRQSNYPAAAQYYQQILNIEPNNADAHLNLGLVFYQLKQNDAAVKHLRLGVKADPERLDIRSQLGFTLTELGQLSEAREIAQKLTTGDPDNTMSWMLMGFVSVQMADIAAGLDAFEKIRELDPGAGIGVTNTCFSSLYADFHSAEEVTELHRRMSAIVTDKITPEKIPLRTRATNDRIRVGYLSPDFRNHPVGFFMEPILGNHNHDDFEIFGYGLQAQADDDTGKTLIEHIDHWLLCNQLDDSQLIERIRADKLDILVDLGGYTANCKMTVLAHRVAPVQAIYLGYPSTTGMPEMDWIIGDTQLIPEKYATLYTERPARLTSSFLCFKPRPGTPDVVPTPALENGFVTFGSYNNLPKLSDRCINLWAKVLNAVPNSELILKALSFSDEGTKKQVLNRFAKAGVAPQRIKLLGPTVPITSFLAEYGRIDIALDTLPYNGGTTSCDALWMGVPVVTLAGQHFFERMGSSILTTLGRPEWVANDENRYVEIAVELAADFTSLASLRGGLRNQMQQSPLCDAQEFTRELESLYRDML
jgi:protein O-GlcNAc transferase